MKVVPRLGFPNEDRSHSGGNVVYKCEPAPWLRIVMWQNFGDNYRLNLYHYPPRFGDSETDRRNRAIPDRIPTPVDPVDPDDPIALQLTINYLVQLYQGSLPTEVTENETA